MRHYFYKLLLNSLERMCACRETDKTNLVRYKYLEDLSERCRGILSKTFLSMKLFHSYKFKFI